MIEEPPLVRLLTRSSRNRPTPAQIAAFAGVQSSIVCDAMNGTGALDAAIKPLAGVPDHFHGPAITADNGPGDILALLCVLDEVEQGDVILTAVQGHGACAAVGDMVAAQAKNAGAAAIVTDGRARDIAGIRAVGLPVFATGLTPNSPYKTGPAIVGHPILIGGRAVTSGDMVIGDEDGVVTVPFDQIDAVIAQIDLVRASETKREAEVQAGMVVPDKIKALLASDRIERT